MKFLLPLAVFLAVAVPVSYGAAVGGGGNIYNIWHPYRLPKTASPAQREDYAAKVLATISKAALTAFNQRNDLQMTRPTKVQINAFFDRLPAPVRAELEQCYRKLS